MTFKENDPVTIFSEEVGIINGTYVSKTKGIFSKVGNGDYHDVRDMTGQLCLVQGNQIEPGHHPKGKRKWGK